MAVSVDVQNRRNQVLKEASSLASQDVSHVTPQQAEIARGAAEEVAQLVSEFSDATLAILNRHQIRTLLENIFPQASQLLARAQTMSLSAHERDQTIGQLVSSTEWLLCSAHRREATTQWQHFEAGKRAWLESYESDLKATIATWNTENQGIVVAAQEARSKAQAMCEDIARLRIAAEQDIAQAISNAKNETSIEIAEEAAASFDTLAEANLSAKTQWLVGMIVVGAATALFVWGSQFSQNFPRWHDATLWRNLVSVSLLVYLLFFCSRNFQINAHNAIVNKQRAESLRSFRKIIDILNTDETRNAVMVQVASTIFSHQPSGFTKGDPTDEASSLSLLYNLIKKP